MITQILLSMTDDDWALLCLALGMAAGNALRDGDKELAARIRALYSKLQATQSIDEKLAKLEKPTLQHLVEAARKEGLNVSFSLKGKK